MSGPACLTLRPCLVVLVASLFLVPLAAMGQEGSVPVTVEVLFGGNPLEDLGTSVASTSSSARTSDMVFRDIGQPSVQTQREKEMAAEQAVDGLQLRRRPLAVGGFARYERVAFDTQGGLDLDGHIYSTNLHLAWDIANLTFGVLIPYDFLDLDSLNAHRIGSIVYGQYHLAVSAIATLSVAINGNYTYTAIDHQALDNINTLGGGASVSLALDQDRLFGGATLSYQFNADDSDSPSNQQHLFKLGAMAGMRFGRDVAAALFGIWSRDTTDRRAVLSKTDTDYFDLGVELKWNLTQTWRLSGGYRKILGLENFESDMVFIGTLLQL